MVKITCVWLRTRNTHKKFSFFRFFNKVWARLVSEWDFSSVYVGYSSSSSSTGCSWRPSLTTSTLTSGTPESTHEALCPCKIDIKTTLYKNKLKFTVTISKCDTLLFMKALCVTSRNQLSTVALSVYAIRCRQSVINDYNSVFSQSQLSTLKKTFEEKFFNYDWWDIWHFSKKTSNTSPVLRP